MTGPIMEMTRRNEEVEQVPFVTISTHEKVQVSPKYMHFKDLALRLHLVIVT